MIRNQLDFYVDPMKMRLPGLKSVPPSTSNNTTAIVSGTANAKGNSNAVRALLEDPSKKIRKPYTITKSRESWADQEHDKFLEALQLFDRDWKKIEAFVGSKTAVQFRLQQAEHSQWDKEWKSEQREVLVLPQRGAFVTNKKIRSHAQKYFLKVQKSGKSGHVPPPRPKRKAVHPYPQKVPKTAPVASQVTEPFKSLGALPDPSYVLRPDSLSHPENSKKNSPSAYWTCNSVPSVNVSQVTKDEVGIMRPTVTQNCCSSSSNESTLKMCTYRGTNYQGKGKLSKPVRVMPDFSKVYSFIGSVFDPNARGHLQQLKSMDPINVETVLLLMKNLSVNLTSPEFEDHRKMLSAYSVDAEKIKSSFLGNNLHVCKAKSSVASV